MIKKPTLILNTQIAKSNIEKMISFCQTWQMDFRPHFKTHQSAEIGEWFKELGVKKCTVSSVGMAQYFAEAGWKDISIAIPVNLAEIQEINALAKKIKVNLLVDHEYTCQYLAENILEDVQLFVEIDTGYGRSGIHYQNTAKIDQLFSMIEASKRLYFAGFLSHSGNTYQAENGEDIARVFEQSRQRMLVLKAKYRSQFPNLILSMGDTPSPSFAKDFSEIDEFRPGNFIFYDWMQYVAGVCKIAEISVKLTCPVIGVYPERNEIVIYGGGVHLSKESMMFHRQKIFGWASRSKAEQDILETGFPVISLSQEHGVISVSKEIIKTIKPGYWVDVIPVHSCMTADLYGNYITETGLKIEKYRTHS